MLNNYGVYLWKEAQTQDAECSKAEAKGDMQTAKTCHEKSLALKARAKEQWNHGITAQPTATDIHSNLGYAYSEANELDKAEDHLKKAVALKEISARPHNNLGRVFLRRSQQLEAEARDAEVKGKTDAAMAAKVQPLKDAARNLLNEAIAQFDKAAELDHTLLEAHLNLGEVYLTLKDLDKAEAHYRTIVNLYSETEQDPETISNYSQGWYGLARVAVERRTPTRRSSTCGSRWP